MQELKPVQSVMAKQPLSAFSASDRPALVIDCRELFTAFLHWSAVIPERESQPPAFWQTDPATSLPLWRQPRAPIARSPTVTVAENIFRIRDFPSCARTLTLTRNHAATKDTAKTRCR